MRHFLLAIVISTSILAEDVDTILTLADFRRVKEKLIEISNLNLTPEQSIEVLIRQAVLSQDTGDYKTAGTCSKIDNATFKARQSSSLTR